MLFVENNNGKFDTADFKVFYMAAKALFSGEQVYGVPFGMETGYYKYSPFILLVLSFYTLFSFKVGAIIHFFVIAFSAIFSIIFLEQIVNDYFFKNNKWRILTSFLILLSVLLHFVRDLHLGNTNTILILMMILAIKLTLESKEIAAGILIALVIMTKPYFIVLGLIFLLFKKYKLIATIAITGIALTLSTSIFLGFQNSYLMHIEWFKAMLMHSDYLTSSYTFFYFADYYFGIKIPISYSFPFFILIAISISLFFYKRSINETTLESNRTMIFSYFILIGIIPNILITDVEHFLFSLPLISIVILYLKDQKNHFYNILFAVVIFMYGGNSSDLVGNELSNDIKYWGFVGIGNLIIIGSAFVVYFRVKNGDKSNKEELLIQ
jgi:hypothetical protein